MIGITENSYIGRWCFENKREAQDVISHLNEIPNDLLIPGNWVKYKGHPYEISNPKYVKNESISDGMSPELVNIMYGSDKDKLSTE